MSAFSVSHCSSVVGRQTCKVSRYSNVGRTLTDGEPVSEDTEYAGPFEIPGGLQPEEADDVLRCGLAKPGKSR